MPKGQLLDAHDHAAYKTITRRGGRIVKRNGDGLLATVTDPTTAVESAIRFVTEVGQPTSRCGLVFTPARSKCATAEMSLESRSTSPLGFRPRPRQRNPDFLSRP